MRKGIILMLIHGHTKQCKEINIILHAHAKNKSCKLLKALLCNIRIYLFAYSIQTQQKFATKHFILH